MEYKLPLLEKRDEAKGTKTFIFEKPEGFKYSAGQYCYVTLPKLNYEDKRGPMRQLTLSSSPTESFLSITVRLREQSGFKKTLDELPIGTPLTFKGPQDDFYLDENDSQEQQVMIAGGIGITPFRSIIKYVTDKNLNIPIHLIYSNSLPEEITFKDEFDKISITHPNIQITYTVTKPEESKIPWNGLTGRIDANFLTRLNSQFNILDSTFWLCGPVIFVTALEEVLASLKIPQDRIKVEKMAGY